MGGLLLLSAPQYEVEFFVSPFSHWAALMLHGIFKF
jgi:hypothetical protein